MRLNKLSEREVKTVKDVGRHSDGGGLYLQITGTGGRSWLFMWKKDGRQREMGLGPLSGVPLGAARKLASEARELVAAGGDPIEAKHRAKPTVPTFGQEADALIKAMSPSWRNPKHRAQWEMTLREYAAPLRAMPVDTIGTGDVLAVLSPLWQAKPETASRLRGRIEAVLAAATVKGHRSGPNPAQWRHHLDRLLPKAKRLSRGHHAALPFPEVPAFIARLRAVGGTSALALEFTILTAARSGEVLGARWDEIDQEASLWTVPADRMKAGRVHRVPLCDRALAILRSMSAIRIDDHPFVFPGQKRRAGLSNMALEMALRRLKVDATTHGFRSAFRDWCGEETNFPREVAEAALAHVVGDETERAYRRGDALAKRRAMMTAWSAFCDGDSASIVRLAGSSL